MTFIRYIGVGFTFGVLDCVRYNEDFVISRFCSVNFTVHVTLAGLKNIVYFTKDFVIQMLVKSRYKVTVRESLVVAGLQWQGLSVVIP